MPPRAVRQRQSVSAAWNAVSLVHDVLHPRLSSRCTGTILVISATSPELRFAKWQSVRGPKPLSPGYFCETSSRFNGRLYNTPFLEMEFPHGTQRDVVGT
jgi:hypothetical protein